jgi:hypothetical protein
MNNRAGPSSNPEASGNVTGKRKSTGRNKSASRNKPTGKKGDALEINEENMAFYKAMQAKLKAEKKTAAASQDEGKLL